MRDNLKRVLSVTILFSLLVSGALAHAADTKTKTKKKRRSVPANVTVVPVPRTDPWWVKRQETLNARVQPGDAQLLFIGDSITQGWEGKGASEVWQKYYGNRHAVNLGIGGDQTQHVLWRLDHGNIDGIKPKLAVLMIGTNNAGSCTSEQIADGVKAIVEKLRTKLPETKVLVLAIFPRGADGNNPARQVNIGANERIAKLDDGQNVFYLDIGKEFLNPDGTLSKKIMPDLLHLSAKGYEIWGRSIEPTVAKVMGDAQ
jgi:beta-glucosidase